MKCVKVCTERECQPSDLNGRPEPNTLTIINGNILDEIIQLNTRIFVFKLHKMIALA